jgi:Dienelactone hydrolase family
MAFITAARYEVDAAVAYHGGDTEKYLGEVGGLDAPLLMHLGEEDEFISKTAQAQIKAALAKKAQRHRLQLSGSASRLLPAQRDALQYRGGCARQQADKSISTKTTAVSFGRVWQTRNSRRSATLFVQGRPVWLSGWLRKGDELPAASSCATGAPQLCAR